ncbi:methyltransferase domain-containing protein [Pseudorhodobacter sp.]|uniref:methyltransferase domain-containing protein n=1 Tax=Pseudorhodobacter sp. TaxID=1934400 RepID=UPI0026484095|nr:methyltransferase domain-containing protein [Pseudorhodobacter sp.]MDN5787952.1 methyltransferase domain-containing protein [Pseudorhodobacter sp.]
MPGSGSEVQNDWNPQRYARFSDLRLRPALDLLAQVPQLPEGVVIDLGCGTGVVGPALSRHCGRALIGVDSSPAMLEDARNTGVYARLVDADVQQWQPPTPPALIFSNAALQWVPDHQVLLRRLAGMLTKGGILAVQMPRQGGAPSHRFLRDIAASLFGNRFADLPESPVQMAVKYWQMLAPLGEVTAWETEYVQRLEAQADGHPVRAFTQSTTMRPYLAGLDAGETAKFFAAYDTALTSAYPVMADGSALLPFVRVFFTLKV